MAIIPPSLQPPPRQPTVRQEQIIKQYGSVAGYEYSQEQKAIYEEAQRIFTQMQGLSLEEYERQRLGLSPEIQRYFEPSAEIKKRIQVQQQKIITGNLKISSEQKNYYQSQINRYSENIKKGKARGESDDQIAQYESEIDRAKYFISAWNEAESKYLSKGYGYGDVEGWVHQKVSYNVSRLEARREARKAVKLYEAELAKAPPAQQDIFLTDIKSYERAGFTKAESQVLAQWSAEHYMTPTPEYARQITREAKETPRQRALRKLGIEPSPFFQIEPPRPSLPAVTLPTTDERYLQISTPEALMWTGARAVQDVKTFFGGRTHDYMGVRGWFEPFEHVGIRKIEEPSGKLLTEAPIGWTQIIEAPTTGRGFGFIGGMREATYRDIQGEIELKRNIELPKIEKEVLLKLEKENKKLRDSFIKGKISQEKLEIKQKRLLEEIQKEFSKEAEKLYKKYPDVPGLYEQTGIAVPRTAERIVETGALFHPLSATIFGAMKMREPKETIIDIDKPLAPEYRVEKYGYEPALYFGSALVGGMGRAFQTGKEITPIRLEELKDVPFSITGREIVKKEGKTLLKVSASKTTGYASAEVEILIPIKTLEKGKFAVGTGKGVSKVRVVDFMMQGVVKKPEEAIIKKTITFVTAGKGVAKEAFIRTPTGNIKIEDIDLFITAGEGWVTPKAEPTTFFTFGGITRRTEEGYKVVAGELKKARLYPEEMRFTGLFPIETRGEILKLTEKEGVKVFFGAGKKSPKQFLKSLYGEEQVVSPFVEKVLKITTEKAIKEITPKVIKTYPTIVGGVGVESIYTGKQYLVPLGTEEAVTIAGVTTKPRIIDKEPLSVISITGLVERQKHKPITKLITKDIFKTAVAERGIVSVAPVVSLEIVPKERIGFVVPTKLLTKQLQLQKQITGFGLVTPVPTITPRITPTITGIPIAIPFWFPGEKYIKGEQVGYHAHVKDKGKWNKVSIKPRTRQSAQSLGARIVDNTTSAQFKIEPIKHIRVRKGKKTQVVKMFREDELTKADGYFGRVLHKFRDFVIVKGRKKKIKDRWIEKKTKRIDTRGEAQGLTVAQWKSRQRKITLGLPTRRTKKTKGGKKPFFRL